MPRRNRVTPFGELIAVPDRGLVHGNRGCLHDPAGAIRRHHVGRRWIACRLEFRDWHRSPLMQPGRYTELFFLDEATALTAGHRPCALCRREDHVVFAARWEAIHDERGVDAIDARLHTERLDRGRQRRHRRAAASLPDGAFIMRDGDPFLVRGEMLFRWTPGGYVDPVGRPRTGTVEVITPPSILGIVADGWDPVVPFVHPSATG